MNKQNQTVSTKNDVIRVGVSSCLLGQKVRHDGGHTRNHFVVNTLGQYFHLEPFCPELSAGLSVPRPSIHLKKIAGQIRVVGTKDATFDVTENLQKSASKASKTMYHLSGYILKKDSPSCGMERVRVYNETGQATRTGHGVFAETLLHAHPNLPVEEEGRLCDPKLRENFILRVFTYHRWQQLTQNGLTVSGLIDFHTKNKFNLLAHDENTYRQLGKLVANTTKDNLDAYAELYIQELMTALKTPATRKRHTNVLMHMMGYLKTTLTRGDKKEFISLLDQYRSGKLPLIVPITLLKHHLRSVSVPYIRQQTYIQPYPDDLMLRNHL